MTPAKKAGAAKQAAPKAETTKVDTETTKASAEPVAPAAKITGAHRAKHSHGDGDYPSQPGVPPLVNR